MKDTSIEYAHIYTNAKIGEEHEVSLRELDAIRSGNESLVVLVDDYSFPDPTFDYAAFIAWLADHGHKPDVVMRESQLIPLCDQTLEMISGPDVKEELVDYIKARKYPCSLFIAAWYLLRLGKLTHPGFSEQEYAKNLLNILPESFRPFEDKGLDIIRATPHAGLVQHIQHRYIRGRLLA